MFPFALISKGRHGWWGDYGAFGDGDPRERRASGTHGMVLFLISLGVLFAATIVLHLVVEHRSVEPRQSGMPVVFALSTAVMIASSGTMHAALLAARQDRRRRLQQAMIVTFVLGLVFLALQTYGWLEQGYDERNVEAAPLLLLSFYVLTGLHAMHVIGGLAGLSVVTLNAFRRRYSSRDYVGVWLCSLYWHFLDGVWIVLFIVLFLR